MPLNLSRPILYLITRGATTEATTPDSSEFRDILVLISSAVDAGIDLIQVREKNLTARALFELISRAVEIKRGTSTRLLVNDRADIAAGAGADGVHLTTQSIDAAAIRKTFSKEFLIGASTHSLAEAIAARNSGADFVVLGPIYKTKSKEQYGSPLGVSKLSEVTRALDRFPVLALGGISADNASDCLNAGAAGIAGISLFGEPENLSRVVNLLKESAKELSDDK
jgi:thiamine-phosphate pyrophosphorylase